MIDILNKHIVVAGAARSGVSVSILLKEKGAVPFLSDISEIDSSVKERLQKNNILFESGGHSSKAMDGDMLVLSPGVPSTSSIAVHYKDNGKPIYSEIEVASWFNLSPIVAVTGSNGKTTVTSWLSDVWTKAGKDYIMAGNIGTALSEQVNSTSPDCDLLLEVSSFQLDHISGFHPSISMILNITPDHLDRYNQNFQAYCESKFRITENQNENDWFIYNDDDSVVKNFAKRLLNGKNHPKMAAFSTEHEVPNGAFVRNGQLMINLDNKEESLMAIDQIALPGNHNLKNGMAMALAARASEIRNEFIRESLKSFEGVAHRLEKVRTLDGVTYFNDSKATNINAVWYALDSFNVPLTLILGGRDKGNDYNELDSQIKEKVHTIIAIGEAKEAIKKQLGSVVPHMVEAGDMKEAVKLAKKTAKRGEVVLLSPACASFDMFDNYEHRGDMFKKAVLEL